MAQALEAAGFSSASQLRSLSATQLEVRFGLRRQVAEWATLWARGEDPRQVQERGPPRAIQVTWAP